MRWKEWRPLILEPRWDDAGAIPGGQADDGSLQIGGEGRRGADGSDVVRELDSKTRGNPAAAAIPLTPGDHCSRMPPHHARVNPLAPLVQLTDP